MLGVGGEEVEVETGGGFKAVFVDVRRDGASSPFASLPIRQHVRQDIVVRHCMTASSKLYAGHSAVVRFQVSKIVLCLSSIYDGRVIGLD